MNRVFILILLVLGIVTACSYEEHTANLIPEVESNFAKSILTELRKGDFAQINSLLSEDLRAEVDLELLTKMQDYFRDGEPVGIEIIGSQVHTFNEGWTGNFTFEYEFESGWNLANVALRRVGHSYEIVGLNVYQTTASQRALHKFDITGKTAIHYLILLAAVVCPLSMANNLDPVSANKIDPPRHGVIGLVSASVDSSLLPA